MKKEFFLTIAILLSLTVIIAIILYSKSILNKTIDQNGKEKEINLENDLYAKAHIYVAAEYGYTSEKYDIEVNQKDSYYIVKIIEKGKDNIINAFTINAEELKKWKEKNESNVEMPKPDIVPTP